MNESNERPMTIFEASLWTIGSVVALVSVGQLLQKIQPSLKNDSGAGSLCQVIAYLALLLVIQTVYFPRTKLSVIFATKPGKWVFYPIAAILGIAILFPASALYEAALQRWPAPPQSTEIMGPFRELSRFRQVTAGLGIVLVTPLVEEALFRGALFGTLRRRYAAPWVVVSTAIFFAMIHGQPQILIPIGLVGAALAFLRVASGSMWPGVVMHMAFNGLSFYAQATGNGDSDEPTPVKFVLAGAVISASLLALTDYLRTRNKEREPDVREEEQS